QEAHTAAICPPSSLAAAACAEGGRRIGLAAIANTSERPRILGALNPARHAANILHFDREPRQAPTSTATLGRRPATPRPGDRAQTRRRGPLVVAADKLVGYLARNHLAVSVTAQSRFHLMFDQGLDLNNLALCCGAGHLHAWCRGGHFPPPSYVRRTRSS